MLPVNISGPGPSYEDVNRKTNPRVSLALKQMLQITVDLNLSFVGISRDDVYINPRTKVE